jgi:hypothetical protein
LKQFFIAGELSVDPKHVGFKSFRQKSIEQIAADARGSALLSPGASYQN